MTRVTVHAEHRRDSPWLATPRPRLSWVVETDVPDWAQHAVEISLADGRVARLDGPAHNLVPWPFADLAPREAVVVTIRVCDEGGNWSEPSTPLELRNGVLADGEWRAPFLGLADPARTAQPYVIRRRIEIERPLRSATLYWSALGAATARIDGQELDDAVLSPGWTSYPDRVLHESIDVTHLLPIGAHMLGFEVTGAWFTETYGFGDEARRVYGDQPSVAAQLHLEFADGDQEIIAGPEWDAAAVGAVRESGLYTGEVIDARHAIRWWLQDENGTWPAAVVAEHQPTPVARASEPVRRIESLAVRDVLTTPSGKTVLDFGQNLVGRLRVEVAGPAGTQIVLRHAEVLEHGELGTRPLRRATSTDTIVLAGEGREAFEPAGTFHGFRYVEVTGWPGEIDPNAIRAIVLHSDMQRTGWFTTSHPLLQRLHENVVWGMRGNFLALPTDCPQRDERLGWTGDAQVFAPTAATLYDCGGFLRNWLTDLRLEQDRAGGVVPNVVPNVFGFAWPAAGWGDAATVIPSVIHERAGDSDVLGESVDSMHAWVEAELEAAGGPGLWESTLQFGDWLDPDAPADMAGAAKTAPGIVATAYLHRSLALLAAAADGVGRATIADDARRKAAAVRAAFAAAYVTADGRMVSDAPTAYAIALRFDLIEDPCMRTALAARLAHVTTRDAFHISTGFLGTPLVLDALTDYGYDRDASALLLQTRMPSWLYPVTMGATTMWERWDSMLPDGTINPGEMTSFNHYALGAVVDWLYRRVAGIAPIEPGYARVRFAPIALRGLDDAHAVLDTPAGRFEAGWRRDGGHIEWTLSVPAHARAEVDVPGLEPRTAGPGRHTWKTADQAPTPTDPVTLWTPVAGVVSDPRAYDAVMGVLERHDPSLADNVRRRTDWTLRTPLAVALFSVPGGVVADVDTALSALAAQ